MIGLQRVTVPCKAAWRTLLKLLHKPLLAWLLLSGLTIGIVLGVRSRMMLQRWEFWTFDKLIQMQMEPESQDDTIKLVGMTENDLEKFGYPVPDDVLIDVLERIAAQKPAVIAFDMYRNLPEPRIRKGTPWETEDEKRFAEFCKRLVAIEKLIAIERFGVIAKPPAFKDDLDRVSVNNLNKDEVDGVYRRAPLILELGTGGEPIPTLSFLSVAKYLEHHEGENGGQFGGTPWEMIPDPEDPGRPLIRLGKTVIPRLTEDAGGYVGLTRRDYEYLISYRSPLKFRKRKSTTLDPLGQSKTDTPYDFSFSEIQSGRTDEGTKLGGGELTGKIVVVATVMQSIKDSNPTPIHDNFRGVQQHIIMMRQLLDAAYGKKALLSWWSEWAEVLWIVGWTLLGGVLGLFFRSPMRLVPAVVLATIALALAVKVGFDRGFWLLFVAPGIGCLFGAALVTSFVVLIERADRAAVQEILNKHVSRRVADYIMTHREHIAEGGMIPARALRATIMFTDLAGFSTASEKLTPEQTLRWLNDYMTAMVRIIEEYEGDVNKFIGDAIMALFGAPIASDDDAGLADDAVKAIRAALRMREEVPKLNARWRETEPDMPPVAMRVGIFTGPIVDGGFGATDRTEYTVIGDAVNRANRLEAAGKEIKDQLTAPEKLCTILIGPESFKRVGHLFETAPVENLSLKGITERVTVYRVLSERTNTPASQPQKP